MNFEIISILILIFVFFIGGLNYKKARQKLNETEGEKALSIYYEAKNGITAIVVVLFMLLIIGLIIFDKSSQLIYLIFFTFSLIIDIVYYLRFKAKLTLSELPGEFIKVASKTYVYRLLGIALVVVAFSINIK